MNRILCGLGLVLSLAACNSSEAPPPKSPETTSSPATTPTPATATTFEEQVAQGQKLYAANCASCHGASGEGGKAPKVVGVNAGALPLDPPPTAKYRKTQFKTAADVATFVVQNMPPTGGKLSEEQYWAILAFDLKANGVDLKHKLDSSTASSVAIH